MCIPASNGTGKGGFVYPKIDLQWVRQGGFCVSQHAIGWQNASYWNASLLKEVVQAIWGKPFWLFYDDSVANQLSCLSVRTLNVVTSSFVTKGSFTLCDDNGNEIVAGVYTMKRNMHNTNIWLPLPLPSSNGSTNHSTTTPLPLPLPTITMWTAPFDLTQPIHYNDSITTLQLPSHQREQTLR